MSSWRVLAVFLLNALIAMTTDARRSRPEIKPKLSTLNPPSPDDSDEVANENAKVYLRRFGHIDKGPTEHVTDEDLERGLRSIQDFAGLTVTGRLDNATRELMCRPRCGLPDIATDDGRFALDGNSRTSVGRIKRYVAETSWPYNRLKYRLHRYPSQALTSSAVNSIIRRAFQYWTDECCLQITPTWSPLRPSELHLGFFSGRHHDNYPFDGPGGVLAHAFFPVVGHVHFDNDEIWTNGTTYGINLMWAAVHEIGHALGLDHSTVPSSIMYPYYRGYTSNLHLDQDDIDGIRFLYGYCPAVETN